MNMRKITLSLIVISAIFLCNVVNAQDSVNRNSDQVKKQQDLDSQKIHDQDKRNSNSVNQNRTDQSEDMDKDHIAMENGKMIAVIDGKIIPMDQNVTMKNGTECMTDGTCMLKSGKKIIMKNGDMMDMNGVMFSKDHLPQKAN